MRAASRPSLRIGVVSRHLTCGENDSCSSLIQVHPEVQRALELNQPVVALESTIISHGMPFPQNLEVALEVEAIVRDRGAVPATIAIIAGVPCVGLSRADLERLARRGSAVRKCSRRELALAAALGQDGATTVSATMLLAHAAGIRVFVTGGIGGVHRGAERSMDVSADLTELGRTPVAVVCAGVKSILDIPKTLEFLETQGVLVAGWRTNDFPAFFSASSGCPAPCRFDTPDQAARTILASSQLGLTSGMVIGVPVPADSAAEGERIESAIQQALAEAQQRDVSGSAVTPFLLERLRQLTDGESLRANISLIKNNASVGAGIAIAVGELQAGRRP